MGKKKTLKGRKAKISITRIIIFLTAAFIIIRSGVCLVLKHPKTEVIKYGEIEVSENVTGYIIKNETVANAPITGQLVVKVPEGTKVRKGITVASIIKDGANEDYEKKIKNIDDQIAEAKNSTKNTNLFDDDVNKLDQDITDEMKQVEEISSSGNIENISHLKTQINELISKKLVISGEEGFAGANVKEKLKEREAYVNAMNSIKADIPTSDTGILSYKLDGFEKSFTLATLKNLTVKELEKMTVKDSIGIPQKVEAGNPVVKIINNFEWYMVCIVNTENIKSLKQGGNISIGLNDGTTFPAKIYSIKSDENGKSLLTLYLTTNLEHFYSLRKADVKIIKKHYEGLKIRTSSLINKDGKRGVMIIDKGVVEFKEVDLVGFDGDYAIVYNDDKISGRKGLSLYDEIVTNPMFVKEDTLIK